MLEIERISSCLRDEDYDISLPLSVQVSDREVELRSSLRLLGTLIQYGMAEVIHVSARESIVVISSGNFSIGFVWKMMPKGILLLRDIRNLDEFKEAKCSVKVLSFTKSPKGVAA